VNDSEWFPFIDAYLHLGKIDQAKSLSQKVLDTHDTIYQFACAMSGSIIPLKSVTLRKSKR